MELIKNDPELQPVNPVLLKIMRGAGIESDKMITNLSNISITKIRVSEAHFRELFAGNM